MRLKNTGFFDQKATLTVLTKKYQKNRRAAYAVRRAQPAKKKKNIGTEA